MEGNLVSFENYLKKHNRHKMLEELYDACLEFFAATQCNMDSLPHLQKVQDIVIEIQTNKPRKV